MIATMTAQELHLACYLEYGWNYLWSLYTSILHWRKHESGRVADDTASQPALTTPVNSVFCTQQSSQLVLLLAVPEANKAHWIMQTVTSLRWQHNGVWLLVVL